MGRWTAERLAAASGIAFAVVLLVASLLPGSPKKYNASAASIVSYLHDKHREILIGGVLSGIALVLFLWFVASFAGTFRDAGQGRLATIVYGAGVATVAIAAISDGTMVALARLSYWVDPKTVQGLYGVDSFFYGRLFWTLTALGVATTLAVRRSRVLPEWYGWLSAAGSVVFVLGAVSEKTKGFFSPGGGMEFIAFLVFLAWVLISSVLLVQKLAAAPTSAPSTSPM